MDDGKVSFKTEIQAPSLTKDQLYGTMLKWATERFKPEGKFNARVLYTNEDEGTIAAGGEEYHGILLLCIVIGQNQNLLSVVYHLRKRKM